MSVVLCFHPHQRHGILRALPCSHLIMSALTMQSIILLSPVVVRQTHDLNPFLVRYHLRSLYGICPSWSRDTVPMFQRRQRQGMFPMAALVIAKHVDTMNVLFRLPWPCCCLDAKAHEQRTAWVKRSSNICRLQREFEGIRSDSNI